MGPGALAGLAALNIGGAGLGGIFQKLGTDSANAANQDALNRALIRLQEGLYKGENSHLQGIQEIRSAFRQGQGALAGQGAAARARIQQRESQALGASDAGLASRGLYSSTRAMGQRRAIHDQTNVALAGVDEAVGAQSARLYQNQGITLGRAYARLAAMQAGGGDMLARTELANQHVASNVGPQVASMMGNLSKLLMFGLSNPAGGGGGYGPLQADGSF